MEYKEKCTDKHQYGTWFKLDEKNTARECELCGHILKLPNERWKNNQLEKQFLASSLLEGFLLISPDEPNLINYLNIILDDVVDYINKQQKKILDEKLRELTLSTFLNNDIKIAINNLRLAILNNDIDLCDQIKHYFNLYYENLENSTSFTR